MGRRFRARVAATGGVVLVLTLAVAAFGLAPGASAQTADNQNCPPGFTWVRMSGTGCVQDRATLPANGKIGYDGGSVCMDPYIGIYERRGTTDGKPAPGGPYTSFVFLKKCVTQAEYDQLQKKAAQAPAATTTPSKGSPPPGSSTGGEPSTGRMAASGVAVGGLLLALGSGAVLLNRRGGHSGYWENRTAAEAALRSLRDRLDALATRTADLDRLAARVEEFAGARGSVAWDVNDVASEVAALLSARWPSLEAVGLYSLVGTVASTERTAFSAAELQGQAPRLLEDIAAMRGAIDAERGAIEAEIAAASSGSAPVAPDRLAAEAYTDPELLQRRIEEVHQEINGLRVVHTEWDVKRSDWQVELNRLGRDTDRLNDAIHSIQENEDWHAAVNAAGSALAIVAGVISLVPTTIIGSTAAVAGWAAFGGNTAAFAEWARGATAEDATHLFRCALRGQAYTRGQIAYRMADAVRRQEELAARIKDSEAYLARLRGQQGEITVRTGRGVLWSKPAGGGA